MTQINPHQLARIDAVLGRDNPATPLSWRSAGQTHIGHVRPLNEDAFFESVAQQLWCVADGMGGLSRGDFASKAIIKAIQDFSRQPKLSANIEDLQQRLLAVNDTCRKAFRHKRLGSTVASLFAFNDACFCLWAGDSRIYRLRNNELSQLTEDHTVLQEKLAQQGTSNNITADQANHHSAHVLTRAVGVHKTLRLSLTQHTVRSGDRFLLCSDGLYNSIARDDIRALLGRADLNQALSELFDAALQGGGQDNITAITAEAY